MQREQEREIAIAAKELQMNCSAAGPLPKLTAKGAASESFQM